MEINPLLQPVDSQAPQSLFAKNGYYLVGNHVYLYKVTALEAASQNKLPIRWYFNDHVFDQVKWRESSGLSLRELYRLRAQQLRQKYDYLILAWSGGADSTNILDSFIDNDIDLDEIVICWPYSQTRGKYRPDSTNQSSENILSEWDFSIEPRLRWLQQYHPKIRVTIRDMMAEMPRDEFRDDTVKIIDKHNFGSIQRYREIDQVIRERSEKISKLAVITGVSPINPVLINGILSVIFFDTTIGSSKSDFLLDGVPRNMEWFYWSPDMPEIVKEQGHVLLQFLRTFPKACSLLDQYLIDSDRKLQPTYKPQYEDLRQLRKILFYPKYPIDIFQAHKPKDMINQCEMYAWFYNNPHSVEFLKSWQSAIASYQRSIDPRYFIFRDGRLVDYSSFHTKFYPIGQIENTHDQSNQSINWRTAARMFAGLGHDQH